MLGKMSDHQISGACYREAYQISKQSGDSEPMFHEFEILVNNLIIFANVLKQLCRSFYQIIV